MISDLCIRQCSYRNHDSHKLSSVLWYNGGADEIAAFYYTNLRSDSDIRVSEPRKY